MDCEPCTKDYEAVRNRVQCLVFLTEVRHDEWDVEEIDNETANLIECWRCINETEADNGLECDS
jgi:hypothetical protein